MARQLTINVRAEGVRETLAAFRSLPKDANNELRAASLDLSRLLALKAAAAGEAEGSQAALVAGTVKAARDRVPVVQAGGTKRLGSRRKPAWKLLFGSEFGSNQYTQFPRLHQGREGIWFFPTIEENAAEIAARWREAADRTIAAFSKGAD
ncbi:hypothetical protein [Brevundimonas sp.]|uniref:hypothetical protein n=1 Tax=Brevundimonas sp. TaxID=1871086 RepID=UPI002D374FE9|nr:hypothetical protein [Brevundimonas sp.]HYD28883.1 hypothetical protein [Brevundimonas sp.]